MQIYISINDDNEYTHLLKLLKSLGGSNLKYKWLISDIEAYPQNRSYIDLFNNDYIFLLKRSDYYEKKWNSKNTRKTACHI